MLTRLGAYLKKVDKFAWHAQRKERKAMVLDSLKQEEPNLKPLNGYLKHLERCLQRAEASFKIFTDHCDEAIKRLNEVHEDCKGAADKAKLAQAITE